LNKAMRYYLETCTRCGVCVDACHVYASMGQSKYISASRHELVRRLYKKYFKARGKLWPFVGEARELDDTAMRELYDAAYSCTGCRRCMVYCPFGIDTQMIMSIAKLLLIGANMEPEILTMLADMSIEKGKSIEFFKENFLTGIKNLEAEVFKKWQSEAGTTLIPIDVEDANILYVALSGGHSIIPAAAVFNAAKENWTLSYFEAVNFGAFAGDPVRTKLILERIVNEARRLRVKEVCICECGTAFRVMKQMTVAQPFKVSSITDVHARYLKEGRMRLKKLDYGPVTYHDPCQLARNGGVIDEPRFILRNLTDNFIDMTNDVVTNWCCGGGGGLVALGEENLDFRMKSARVKADQIKQTGAAVVATACENCHTQLSNLNDYYKLGVKVQFLSSMVADALIQN
jgi:Fe-S oxidoreductase